LDSYPDAKGTWRDPEAAKEFGFVQEIIQNLRTIRAEMKLDPKKRVAAEFYSADAGARSTISANSDAIQRLAFLSELQIATQKLPQSGGGVRSTAQFDVRIPYAAETIDAGAERIRINKEIDGLRKAIASKEGQLGNDTFRSKAPEKIIKQMEEALAAQRVELQKLTERLHQLGNR